MADSPLNSARNKVILIIGISLWVLMHFNMLAQNGLEWNIALTDTFWSNGWLFAIALLLMTILRYYRPQNYRYLYLLIWCVALSGLWSAVVRFGLGYFFRNEPDYINFLVSSMNFRSNIALLVCACSSLLSILWFSNKEQMKKEQRRQLEEKQNKEAELYKLRQQLQPHFLFNSLNSISALAGSRPEEARKMIQQLSDFLRGTIRKDELQRVELDDELHQLNLYLEIEKVRFGHRLQTAVNVEESCHAMKMPPMVLQPLVENAIKFGLYDITGDVLITIDVRCEENMLQITVTNPFDPASNSHRKGTGYGLSSLQRRLLLLFGRNDLVIIQSSDEIFTITVKIPQYDQGNPGG